jgi:hypothetical protein
MIEFRCPHGFYRSQVHCAECSPSATSKVRRSPGFRFVIGSIIAGAQIVGRVSNDRIECICECGEEFEITRSSVARHHKAGTKSRCLPCQKRHVANLMDARRGTAAE